MTNPVANFSGLASGVQWNDVVDQIMKAEEARRVTPIVDRLARQTAAAEAWTTFRGLVEKLNDASRDLRSTGFGGYTSTVSESALSGRTLFNATASPLAEAGRYRVEVVQLAETAKLAGSAVADKTAALGWTGNFSVNGAQIEVAAGDSLEAVRNSINAANTGAAPTGVIASIQNDGTTGGRLVLTRSSAGSDGITLTDGTGGMARELGLLDSRSKPVSATTTAIAAALGIAVSPPPASLRVNGQLITVDLSTDSLATIVEKINAAGGQASTEAIPFGDEIRHRLVVDGNVQAVDGDADSQAVLDALGITAGGYSAVRQLVQTGVLTDGGGIPVTASTALAGLQLDGNDLALANGDAINIRGLRGDGTVVSIGIAIDPGETVQDLLDKINDATSGFGAGGRTATASLGADGRIRLLDDSGGASRLSLSMDIVRADGTTGSMGTAETATAGRARELAEGRDAVIRVDGTEYVRGTNSITDAIPNVTLSLSGAEAGTELDLSIERDLDGAAKSAQTFTDAYNEIRKFYDAQRKTDAPLYSNSTLRSMVDSFTSALRVQATTNSTYTSGTLAGLQLDRNGLLALNADTFKQALGASAAEIGTLFGTLGLGGAFVSATDRATAFGTGGISVQLQSLSASDVQLRAREEESRRKLADRRAALVDQFTRMEAALSRLNTQGSALAGLVGSLQNGGA